MAARRRKRERKPRPKSFWPESYEALVRQLQQEHPDYTMAEIEAAIAEVMRLHGRRPLG